MVRHTGHPHPPDGCGPNRVLLLLQADALAGYRRCGAVEELQSFGAQRGFEALVSRGNHSGVHYGHRT
eukprot:9764511-Prorocentrum_lima.AAC.1